MTPNEAIEIVNSKAQGRTRYEGREDFLDEVLVAEIKRLRSNEQLETKLSNFGGMSLKQVRELSKEASYRVRQFNEIKATLIVSCKLGRSLNNLGIKYNESKSVLFNLIHILETLIEEANNDDTETQ